MTPDKDTLKLGYFISRIGKEREIRREHVQPRAWLVRRARFGNILLVGPAAECNIYMHVCVCVCVYSHLVILRFPAHSR